MEIYRSPGVYFSAVTLRKEPNVFFSSSFLMKAKKKDRSLALCLFPGSGLRCSIFDDSCQNAALKTDDLAWPCQKSPAFCVSHFVFSPLDSPSTPFLLLFWLRDYFQTSRLEAWQRVGRDRATGPHCVWSSVSHCLSAGRVRLMSNTPSATLADTVLQWLSTPLLFLSLSFSPLPSGSMNWG